jgi:hypothetical protein
MAELENGTTATEVESTEETVVQYTYLKRDAGTVKLGFKLGSNYSTGSTYEDWLDNKWILLSDEQIAFREENPGCSTRETINMELNQDTSVTDSQDSYTPSIDSVKEDKIRDLTTYDSSSEVNSFTFNGMSLWLDKSTRVGLMNSINIEKSAGREETTLWFEDFSVTINVDTAIAMLSRLELYALECYNKTAEHKSIIRSLETIEEVEAYDYTIGYPEKLIFVLPTSTESTESDTESTETES